MEWLLFFTVVINIINLFIIIKRRANGELVPKNQRTTDRYKILTKYLEVRSEHVLKHGWKSWNKLAKGEFKETTLLIKKYTKMRNISDSDFKTISKLVDEYGKVLDKVASKGGSNSEVLEIELELLRKISKKI